MDTEQLFCPACGYNLSGIPERRCPECGFGYTRGAVLSMSIIDCSRCVAHFRWSIRRNTWAAACAAVALTSSVMSGGLDRLVATVIILAGVAAIMSQVASPQPETLWTALRRFVVAIIALVVFAVLAAAPAAAKLMATAVLLITCMQTLQLPGVHPYSILNQDAAIRRRVRSLQSSSAYSFALAGGLTLLSWLIW